MQKELLKKYADLRAKREALEAEEDELKAEIVKDMQKNKLKKLESEFGVFTVATRTTYKYTGKIKELEEKVKLAKLKEEEQGKAEASETTHLRYTPKSE